MPRHAVEKRLILPFGGIDVAGFAQLAPVRRRVVQYLAVERLGCVELAGFAQPVCLPQLLVGRSIRRSAPVDQNTRIWHPGIGHEVSAAAATRRCCALSSRALYATRDRPLRASARRASRSRVARGTCRYAFARG